MYIYVYVYIYIYIYTYFFCIRLTVNANSSASGSVKIDKFNRMKYVFTRIYYAFLEILNVNDHVAQKAERNFQT